MQEFITPIVRVTKRSGSVNDVFDFYTMPEYRIWLGEHPDTKSYNIQYYKGLGSSDKAEAKMYFQQINKNKK